jgi:hypothetical protein
MTSLHVCMYSIYRKMPQIYLSFRHFNLLHAEHAYPFFTLTHRPSSSSIDISRCPSACLPSSGHHLLDVRSKPFPSHFQRSARRARRCV